MNVLDDEGPSTSSTPTPKTQPTTSSAGILPPPSFVPMPMMPGMPPVPMSMGHMMPMGEFSLYYDDQVLQLLYSVGDVVHNLHLACERKSWLAILIEWCCF